MKTTEQPTTNAEMTSRPWEGVCESCDGLSDHLTPQTDEDGHRWLVCADCA